MSIYIKYLSIRISASISSPGLMLPPLESNFQFTTLKAMLQLSHFLNQIIIKNSNQELNVVVI